MLDPLPPGSAALDAYREDGKWLVVMLWASDCRICNREVYQYVEFHEFHHDVDATVLGVSLDGPDQAAALEFIDRHEISFPNLIIGLEAGSRWFEELTGQRFWGTPGFIVIDPASEIRAQQIGAVPAGMIEDFISRDASGR